LSRSDSKSSCFRCICKALSEEPLTQIISSFQPENLSERYRRYKNPLKHNFALQNDNNNAKNLGEPPKSSESKRVSPLIEEVNSLPLSKKKIAFK
jgi:hypothetical protein